MDRILENEFSGCGDVVSRRAGGCEIVYLETLVNKELVSRFVCLPLTEGASPAELPLVKTERIPPSERCSAICSGAAVIISGDAVYSAAVKSDRGRSPHEPETENVIRGPHDGFTESAEYNMGLLRRIIRSPKLKYEKHEAGTETHTAVGVVWIEGIADERTVKLIAKRIDAIKAPSILDSGYVEELISVKPGRKNFHLYPSMGNSERPDKVAGKLLEGRIAVIVDGSPVVLTAPYLFVEAFQSSEDYVKSVWYAAFVRFLRFSAFFITLYLPALFVALMYFHQELLPKKFFDYYSEHSARMFPLFFEIVAVFFLFELVREVGLCMPKAVGGAVGILGSLILGDAAVEAGITSASVIIIIAASAMCNFIAPPFFNSNVPLRLLLLAAARAGGLYALIPASAAVLVCFSLKRSFGVPFLYPIIPFSLKGMGDVIYKRPL